MYRRPQPNTLMNDQNSLSRNPPWDLYELKGKKHYLQVNRQKGKRGVGNRSLNLRIHGVLIINPCVSLVRLLLTVQAGLGAVINQNKRRNNGPLPWI